MADAGVVGRKRRNVYGNAPSVMCSSGNMCEENNKLCTRARFSPQHESKVFIKFRIYKKISSYYKVECADHGEFRGLNKKIEQIRCDEEKSMPDSYSAVFKLP